MKKKCECHWSCHVRLSNGNTLLGGTSGEGNMLLSWSCFCRSMNRMWISFRSGICLSVEQEVPCFPARTSHMTLLPTVGKKCFSQGSLMFDNVMSSPENGTNSLAPILLNICALPDFKTELEESGDKIVNKRAKDALSPAKSLRFFFFLNGSSRP